MRVTGSMTIFCRGMVLSEFRSRVGRACRPAARSAPRKSGPPRAGSRERRRPPARISCTGRTMASSGGIISRGICGSERGVLQIGAPQHGVGAEVVAHGRNVAGDGAIAQRHQDLGARADQLDAVQVFLARNRAFHQRDVHVLGELLGVHQRALDHARRGWASASRRSSVSRSDMWQPEQPSSQTVARRILRFAHRRPSRISVR